MNIQAVELGQRVDTPPEPGTLPEVGLPELNDGPSQAPRQLAWRWVPDRDEDQTSTPRSENELWPSEALIKALAWASLHAWG